MLVEDGASAAATGGGGVVDELVAGDVSDVAEGGGGTDEREGGEFSGGVGVVGMRGQAIVDDGRGLGDHAGDSHGIRQNADGFSDVSWGGRDRQRTKRLGEGGGFEAQNGQVSVGSDDGGFEVDGKRRSGEVGDELLEDGRSTLTQGGGDFAVPIPRLGDVAVGGEQARRDDEAGSGDSGAEALGVSGDVVDAVDVGDGGAGVIDGGGRKGLLLFEVGDLTGKLVDLLLESGGFGRGVVVGHDSCSD